MNMNSPIETSREFLREYVAETDPEDLVNELEAGALMNGGPLVQALKSIEYLLANPPQDDTLLKLVTLDARVRLERPTDESARSWLQWLVQQIRRELDENLLPFQPMRAQLVRSVPPADERFPHDLRLYPTDEPWLDCWSAIWGKNIFYAEFMKEWDGRTCPTCNTPTVQCTLGSQDSGETKRSHPDRELTVVYRCTGCRCGWTEQQERKASGGESRSTVTRAERAPLSTTSAAPLLQFAQGGSVLLQSSNHTVTGLEFATLEPRYVCAGRLLGTSESGRVLATEKEPGHYAFWDSASGRERALSRSEIEDFPFDVRYVVSLKQAANGRYEGRWLDITGQEPPALFSIRPQGTTQIEQIDSWIVVSPRRWLALAWSWADGDLEGAFGNYYSPFAEGPARVSLAVSRFHTSPPMYYSRQHDWLVTGDQSGFHVYVASTGQPLRVLAGKFNLLGGGGDVVAFHPQQRFWLAVNRSSYLTHDREKQGFYLVDIDVAKDDPRVLRSFSETQPVVSLAFHPSGAWICALLSDGTIHVWETATGHRRPETMAK